MIEKQYVVSNLEILQELKSVNNIVTRSSLEGILCNRAVRGDTEAMSVLYNWLKGWGSTIDTPNKEG